MKTMVDMPSVTQYTTQIASGMMEKSDCCTIWCYHCTFSYKLSKYQAFKTFSRCILCSTDLFGRGIDNERVNIVFNYNMPENSDIYLHRVSVLYCLGMYKQDGQDTMRHDTRGTIITSCPCHSGGLH